MTATLTARHTAHRDAMEWAEARALAHGLPRPLPAVEMPLAGATGHILAAPLVAGVELPGYDNAAMDGYAVRGPGPWRVIGRVLAGQPGPGPLDAGLAVEIATGAVVPAGAERVVPYEVSRRDGHIVVADSSGPDHIRRAGEYVAAGQELLPAGRTLTCAGAGLAASVGVDTVTVRRRPSARLLITGDEIISAGKPKPGQVRDAITPILTTLLQAWKVDLIDVQWVPDHPHAAGTTAIGQSLSDANVTIVCGSSSVGPADGLHDTLTALGATLHVDGVNCRPGHPQVLAELGGRWLVGLPGNPYAALVAAFTVVQPLVAALAGRAVSSGPRVLLLGDVKLSRTTTRLVPVGWQDTFARTIDGSYPGYLGAAAAADALAVVPPHWHRDQPVELLLIPQ